MKKFFIVFFLLFSLLAVSEQSKVAAQAKGKEIRIECKNERLSDVFKRLEKMTEYRMLFTYDDINQYYVTGSFEAKSIEQILKYIIGDKPLTFTIDGRFVTVVRKEKPNKIVEANNHGGNQQSTVTLRGLVVDSKNKPLPGVSVLVSGKSMGIATGVNGDFSLRLKQGGKERLIFSFIGMKPEIREVSCDEDIKSLVVVLQAEDAKIEEVVVTGIVNRKAESFTGSAMTIKREALVSSGTQNILQSLKNIDPSFKIVENVSLGSNPNAMPDIQMRGQTSFNLQGDYSGNANQPLFILDGFETTLQKVYDLDMNRIENITILKDAAAKAIYGSKAANGVVVITTIRPASGELKVSYFGNLNVEVPDLTGYNLMNAKEKLAFEKERGMYSSLFGSAQKMDDIYKQNYDNVIRGVDTYWLSKPLHTGVGSKHSVNLEGGDASMRYQTGVSYNNVVGVMKGSERNTFAINAALSYTYKDLVFRNSIEYTRNNANNSPSGSFSNYVKLNQYYRPYDDNGNVVKILGQNSLGNVYNPLYNGTINTKSESGYTELTDNFNIDWKISPAFRATGSISYSRNDNTSDVFYPASHTMFADYDANGLTDRKGQYTKGNGYDQSITANAGINFNKTIGNHLFFANATWNLSSRRYVATSVVAEGFGNDKMDNISFATQYELYGKPTGYDNRVREIGVIGILNYSYANRYLFDASIRTTGSSMYGSDNRWGAFWSLGAGWNVHNEKFMENVKWVNQLKIRSSLGYTGSQNFDPFQARARYQYGDIVYNGRLGAELLGLPNSSLKWQRTQDFNVGADFDIKHIVNGRFDYYISTTSDLLSDMTIVPSMGFTSYKENLGEIQNKGYEFLVGITPWRNEQKRAWVTLTASALHNNNKIRKIYGIFKSWNESQDANKNLETTSENYNNLELLKQAYTRPSTYYYEGQSMTAIWGVRSLGIDPVTGNEMYLTKNGKSTFVWDTADQVVIGDTNPILSGSIGFNAGYQGFTLTTACNYKFGGDLYNTTLVDRVENVTGYDNLDRRILDSWRNVGDVVQYRALQVGSGYSMNYTKPTSRFVEKDNEFYISSVNLGYEFYQKAWMKKVKLDRLKLSFSMTELVRMSSVKIERGLSYPFARTFTFSLQTTF
jgi:TonB-linked SusC/RagA family outer membrane protein